MDGFDSMQTPISQTLFSEDAEFEIGGLSTQDLSQELVTPYHLLNARADKILTFANA